MRAVGERIRRYGPGDGLPHRDVLAIAERADARVTSIHHSSFGASWIGSDRGLHWVKDGRIDRYAEVPSHSFISAIAEDRSGGLWVGLHPGGLLRMLPNREELRGFDPGTEDVVRTIFPDREGSLWIGTTGSGILRLSEGAAIPIPIGNRSSRVPVLPIVAQGGGRAWVGTLCRGVARIEPGGRALPGAVPGLEEECVRALLEDSEGRLWIGTSGRGLLWLDEQGGGATDRWLADRGTGPSTR